MSEDMTNRELIEQLTEMRKDMSARFEKVEEGQTALQISVAQIVTWQKALTAGITIAIVIAVFLHNEQNARINRAEERIVSRLETVIASANHDLPVRRNGGRR